MKILKYIIIIILAISSCAAGAYVRLQSFLPDDPDDLVEILNIPDKLSTINILVAGLDTSDGVGRTDSLGIAIVDIDSKKIKFMSIPRDSRVLIPKRGWDKINHAYVFGKIELLRETAVQTLSLPINYYVTFNFKTFPAIIDLLGGVTVDVEKRLVYHDYAGKLHIDIPKGVQTLDGKKALHYVRFRHDALADLGRIGRQQNFIKEVTKKLRSPSILPKIPDLIQEAVKMVNTDMSPAQAIKLAWHMKDIKESDLEFITAPGKAILIGGTSYWELDTMKISLLLADKYVPDQPEDSDFNYNELREDMPLLLSKINGKISILNGDGSQGVGKRASQVFQNIGIDVGLTANAKHFDYHSSCIMIPKRGKLEDRESAEALAALCGINKKLISESNSTSSVTIVLGKDKEKIFSNLRAVGTK